MIDSRSKFEKVFLALAPVLLVLAGVLLIVSLLKLDRTQYTVKETAAYTRVSNCIVAKVSNPDTTVIDVEQCYTQVEKDSGVPLERFDKQTHNEE